MVDERMGLTTGSEITSKGATYQIGREAGRGGSAIVYRAVTVGDQVPCLVKEFYPLIHGLVRTESGLRGNPDWPSSIQDHIQKAYQQYLGKKAVEAHVHLDLRKKFDEYIEKPIDTFEDVDTGMFYSVFSARSIEGNDKRCLLANEMDQDMPVPIGCTYLLRILAALNSLHQAGWLHLDISPDNILVTTLTGRIDSQQEKTVPIVKLIDLDNARPLNQEQASDEEAVGMSLKKGYSAPELTTYAKGDRRPLTTAADIYSVGAILFVMLFGEPPSTMDQIRPLGYAYVSSEHPMFKGQPVSSVNLCNRILSKALCLDADKRASHYPDCAALFTEMAELARLSDTTRYSLRSTICKPTRAFRGRDKLLDDIEHFFQTTRNETEGTHSEHALVLKGIGGIGKTQLALAYGTRALRRNLYDTVILAVYEGGIRSLLLDDQTLPINNLTRPNLGEVDAKTADDLERRYLKQKMDCLSNLADQRTLFVLDNFDVKDDPDLMTLLNLKWDFLMTSRRDWTERFPILEVEEISEINDLVDIFLYHASPDKRAVIKVNHQDEAAVQGIIEVLERHTMLVELVARLVRTSGISCQEMQAYLTQARKKHALPSNELNGIRIDVNKDNQARCDTVEGHLRRLFDLAKLSESELVCLKILTIVPVEGISRRLFIVLCGNDRGEALNALTDSGWAQASWNEAMQAGFIRLHPVISEFIFSTFGEREVGAAVEGYIRRLADSISGYESATLSHGEADSLCLALLMRLQGSQVCDALYQNEQSINTLLCTIDDKWDAVERIQAVIKRVEKRKNPLHHRLGHFYHTAARLCETLYWEAFRTSSGEKTEMLMKAMGKYYGLKQNHGSLNKGCSDRMSDAINAFISSHDKSESALMKDYPWIAQFRQTQENDKLNAVADCLRLSYAVAWEVPFEEFGSMFTRNVMQCRSLSVEIAVALLQLARFYETHGKTRLAAALVKRCILKYEEERNEHAVARLKTYEKALSGREVEPLRLGQWGKRGHQVDKRKEISLFPGILYSQEEFPISPCLKEGVDVFQLDKIVGERMIMDVDGILLSGSVETEMEPNDNFSYVTLPERYRRQRVYPQVRSQWRLENLITGGDYEYLAQIEDVTTALFMRLREKTVFESMFSYDIAYHSERAIKYRQLALVDCIRHLGKSNPYTRYLFSQLKENRGRMRDASNQSGELESIDCSLQNQPETQSVDP